MKPLSLELIIALAMAAMASGPALARPRPPMRAHPPVRAQATPPVQPPAAPTSTAPPPQDGAAAVPVAPYGGPLKLLEAPVSTLFPGNTTPAPAFKNPVEGDANAVQRGMNYFNTFNCSGCHAPNGGGGMGPSLSNRTFIYGDQPQNIYLTIYHGRPNGMPSWGAALSESVIWDLVAYVRSISRAPVTGWGQTFSRDAFHIEQIPGEFSRTATPWNETERFGFGQKPNEAR